MRDALYVSPLVLLDPHTPVLAPQPGEEPASATTSWPTSEPPLRYGMASLDHWLDLNA